MFSLFSRIEWRHSLIDELRRAKPWPISNLPVMAKPLERLVAKQLITYLGNNDLLPSLQSACLPLHSTETALIKVTQRSTKASWRHLHCLTFSSCIRYRRPRHYNSSSFTVARYQWSCSHYCQTASPPVAAHLR